MVNLDQRGAISLPLALGFFLVVLLAFGAWGIMRRWKHLAETQLRLDRCVGETAQEFRDTLSNLDSSTLQMEALRASIAAAVLQPELIPPLQAALDLEAARQEWLQDRWAAKRAAWIINRGCGKRGDWASFLPDLPVTRQPPDELGPRPVRFPDEAREWRIQAENLPRHAAAIVRRKENHGPLESRWEARWALPTGIGLPRAGSG